MGSRKKDLEAMLRFVEEAEEMSQIADGEYDEAEILRLAREEPLPADRARALYTKIWLILHPELTEGQAAAAIEPFIGTDRPVD